MNSRLEALISRGYDMDEVIALSSYTQDELDYACERAFQHISRNSVPVSEPNAIFIGGQPGCGKTVMSMNLKNKMGNMVEIGIDNYRMYHPRYLEIEQCIRRHWENRVESENDTPGNDIADFTHLFAGVMTDRLIEMGKKHKYNLLLEWGMREPNGPLDCMRMLNAEGYNNIVLFVVTNKDISYEACKLRAEVINDNGHIIRKVPKSFHDYCVATLPSSIDEIYHRGYENGIVDYMALITRSSEVLWDDKFKGFPGVVFNDYVHSDNKKLDKNDIHFAMKTNDVERVGLGKNIEELKKAKDELLLVAFPIFDISSKVK